MSQIQAKLVPSMLHPQVAGNFSCWFLSLESRQYPHHTGHFRLGSRFGCQRAAVSVGWPSERVAACVAQWHTQARCPGVPPGRKEPSASEISGSASSTAQTSTTFSLPGLVSGPCPEPCRRAESARACVDQRIRASPQSGILLALLAQLPCRFDTC